MTAFNIEEGSLQHKFLRSTAKIQVVGGGFGNGKTAAACIKAIELVRAYPGSNGLIARATYPKLNDTIRKEFIKWCPKKSIKSFPMGQNASNTCTLDNGTTINFRYIQQQGRLGTESTTSNLLSATYDWIIVDQIEDPEITYKDFIDLLGRLRGNTPRCGEMTFIDERVLPSTGPRWFIALTNPTRNWVFKKLVEPLQIYKDSGRITSDLICIRDDDEQPVLDADGKPEILIELYEGSTYENKANLGADFIKTLEAVYRGQMRERFLLGKWGAYEGLVYPMIDYDVHGVSYKDMMSYLHALRSYAQPTFIEAYDYGMASPSCYLLSFVDYHGNVHIFDGFYGKEISIRDASQRIHTIRGMYLRDAADYRNLRSLADPDIFRRKSGVSGTVVGRSIAAMFSEDYEIDWSRGNNDIINGITKVSGYLSYVEGHSHPYRLHIRTAPHLYVATELQFWWDEIQQYAWAKHAATGDAIDKPVDRNDHAMDTTKYLLSDSPDAAELVPNYVKLIQQPVWTEREDESKPRAHRYGRT